MVNAQLVSISFEMIDLMNGREDHDIHVVYFGHLLPSLFSELDTRHIE
jgi:hypothetical protein